MSKCPNCNFQISENDKFCHKCGIDLRVQKEGTVKTGDELTRIKSRLASWFYGSIQLWKKSPVFFLGFGLALMFFLLIPGIKILTVVASGLIIAAFYRSLTIIEEGEMPSPDKIRSFLAPLWSYFLLVQIFNIIVILIAGIIHWTAIVLILPFIMFTIPLAMEEPLPLSELFERSFYAGKENYPVLLVLSLIIVGGNYLLHHTLPFFLFITLPFTFIVILLAYRELAGELAKAGHGGNSTTFLMTN